jgi:hypothetical protein
MGKKTMIMRNIKTAIKSRFLKHDLFVASQTRAEELAPMIRKLRPLDCGIDLIRVGASADGGYLVPDDLKGIEYCFSPGVNTIAEFENQLADRGITSFLADYSVDAPPVEREQFVFDKKFLGASDRDEFFTLSTWKDKYLKGYKADLLLQMDIEGFEYEVILGAPDSLLNQFRIMIIEFHALDKLFDSFTSKIFGSCFEKLLQNFHVVHIHPNNCGEVVCSGEFQIPKTMEFTFLNKRRVHECSSRLTFPHPLDADNGRRRSVVLPKCWYS